MDERRRVKLVPSKSTAMVNPTFKKVQVVYYISNKGQLEHPHIVQVSHLLHHHLRLKDVLERLSVLRGRGMPYLYSWSCKRMYKNGYVWNDLEENDVVFPSEGHEYVLKASQLVLPSPDKQALVEEAAAAERNKQNGHIQLNEEEPESKEKRITDTNTVSRTKPEESKRFADSDSRVSRNSVVLHIMACGGFKGIKSDEDDDTATAAGRKSNSSSSGSWLNKKVEDEEDMICCMSQNPRFGKSEREYFSGSILETMPHHTPPLLTKSSSYKQQRESKTRMSIGGGGEKEQDDDEMKREKRVAGKCVPKRFC